MKAVLAPLDGSPFSERALPVAAWMAERLGGGLSLVSAIDSEDERAARSGNHSGPQIWNRERPVRRASPGAVATARW
jgi:nucleotide-binding universal stress UspA family protein